MQVKRYMPTKYFNLQNDRFNMKNLQFLQPIIFSALLRLSTAKLEKKQTFVFGSLLRAFWGLNIIYVLNYKRNQSDSH